MIAHTYQCSEAERLTCVQAVELGGWGWNGFVLPIGPPNSYSCSACAFLLSGVDTFDAVLLLALCVIVVTHAYTHIRRRAFGVDSLGAVARSQFMRPTLLRVCTAVAVCMCVWLCTKTLQACNTRPHHVTTRYCCAYRPGDRALDLTTLAIARLSPYFLTNFPPKIRDTFEDHASHHSSRLTYTTSPHQHSQSMGFRRRELHKRQFDESEQAHYDNDEPDWEGGRARERKGLKWNKQHKTGFDAMVCVYICICHMYICTCETMST